MTEVAGQQEDARLAVRLNQHDPEQQNGPARARSGPGPATSRDKHQESTVPRPPIVIPFSAPEPEATASAGEDTTKVLAGLLKPPGGRGMVLSGRCGTCGYMLTSPGHRTTCG